MVLWQWLLGIGLGVVATIITTSLAIQYTANGPRRRKISFVQDPNDTCAICFDVMTIHSVNYLNCGHALHEECLKQLKENFPECPTCRQPVT